MPHDVMESWMGEMGNDMTAADHALFAIKATGKDAVGQFQDP